jgi:Mn-dependent DtxR family transcriptional regulator
VGLLKSGGYLNMEKDGSLTLTESGLAIAKKIYDRHTLITQLLERLGVSPETAAQDACKIEHAISDESFEAIQKYVEKVSR